MIDEMTEKKSGTSVKKAREGERREERKKKKARKKAKLHGTEQQTLRQTRVKKVLKQWQKRQPAIHLAKTFPREQKGIEKTVGICEKSVKS